MFKATFQSMSDSDLVDGFEEKPSRDDAPDTCQHIGCEKRPMCAVRFRESPKEYLCYCGDHGVEKNQLPDAKFRSKLR